MVAPRIVCNTRPGVDWNTCGQAAIATMLAYARLGPFATGAPVTDGEAIDWVRRQFPGDLPLGLGTTAFRLAGALRTFGLAVERVHSGWFDHGASRAWERLTTHVSAEQPVPVCIDMGMLGGQAGAGHWAIVVDMDDDHVWLGNARLTAPLPRERFVELWRCRLFPYGHNHAAVLAWT